ncbi:hypothetical protein OBBRIDRAFT_66979 [Obba rivulosa]|uniref:DUF6533 domain-containing protein n=1 Tax=Obba rivulosa TaxID=1052685 RepID=A0A8E2APV4_9APHY|nr:hypothetical protein OBBRIDRAFT_66979 [Obba rivulosa]
MSLSEQDVASQLASVLQSEWTLNCCSAAASTLVLYYHLSTLVDEVDLMHGNKFSSVTVLFYLNRWSIIAWAAINLTTTFNPLAELPVTALVLISSTMS